MRCHDSAGSLAQRAGGVKGHGLVGFRKRMTFISAVSHRTFSMQGNNLPRGHSASRANCLAGGRPGGQTSRRLVSPERSSQIHV